MNSPEPKRRRLPNWVNLASVLAASSLILLMAFWAVHRSELALKINLRSKFSTILNIEVEAIREWVESEKRLASYLAADSQLVESVIQASDGYATVDSQSNLELRLKTISRKLNASNCILMTSAGHVLAETDPGRFPGQTELLEEQFCQSLFLGKSTASQVLQLTSQDNASKPVIVIAAPIKVDDRGAVGFLAISLDASVELTRILKSSHTGATGETVVVDPAGQMVSQSRFGDALTAGAENGFDVVNATRVQFNFDEASGAQGKQILTASRWLPELGVAVITKMDLAEASAPITEIRRFLWTLCALVVVMSLSTATYRYHVYRLKRQALEKDFNRRTLGPYELEDKVGEGGMGVVYQAKHALLRRPTAVKILPPEKSSQASIERFEREVQFTSQLKHPNTISIYDYGRTPNGLFFYAMELLDGVNLEQLIRQQGKLSDGRVIHILRQVCQSLNEAHRLGLIHRDIKPANIMLCDQGGAVDMVKVLDFGMVRERSIQSSADAETLSGTPVYMAPESFSQGLQLDARVDVFAIGAVGFYLLTGRPLIDVADLDQLLNLHRTDLAEATLKELQQSLNADQERACSELLGLIAACVAPNRDRRIASTAELLTGLGNCQPLRPWTVDDANSWWRSSNALVGRSDPPARTSEIEGSKRNKSLDESTALKLAETEVFVCRKPPGHDEISNSFIQSTTA